MQIKPNELWKRLSITEHAYMWINKQIANKFALY